MPVIVNPQMLGEERKEEVVNAPSKPMLDDYRDEAYQNVFSDVRMSCDVSSHAEDYSTEDGGPVVVRSLMGFFQNWIREVTGDMTFLFLTKEEISSYTLSEIHDNQLWNVIVSFINSNWPFLHELCRVPTVEEALADGGSNWCVDNCDEYDECFNADGDRTCEEYCESFGDWLYEYRRDHSSYDNFALSVAFEKHVRSVAPHIGLGSYRRTKPIPPPDNKLCARLKATPAELLLGTGPQRGTLVKVVDHYLYKDRVEHFGTKCTVVERTDELDERGVPMFRVSCDHGRELWPADMLAPWDAKGLARTGDHNPEKPREPEYPYFLRGDVADLKMWDGPDCPPALKSYLKRPRSGVVTDVLERNGEEYIRVDVDRGRYLWRARYQILRMRNYEHVRYDHPLGAVCVLRRPMGGLSKSQKENIGKVATVFMRGSLTPYSVHDGQKVFWDRRTLQFVQPGSLLDVQRYEKAFHQGLYCNLCHPHPGAWPAFEKNPVLQQAVIGSSSAVEIMQSYVRAGVDDAGMHMVGIATSSTQKVSRWPARYLLPDYDGSSHPLYMKESVDRYARPGLRILLNRQGFPGCEEDWSEEREKYVGMEAMISEVSPANTHVRTHLTGNMWWNLFHCRLGYTREFARDLSRQRPGNISPGDVVRIGRHIYCGRNAWDWNSYMDKFVGVETRVVNVSLTNGFWRASVEADGGQFAWRMRNMYRPEEAERVEAVKPAFKVGDYVKVNVSTTLMRGSSARNIHENGSYIIREVWEGNGHRYPCLYKIAEYNEWLVEPCLASVPKPAPVKLDGNMSPWYTGDTAQTFTWYTDTNV